MLLCIALLLLTIYDANGYNENVYFDMLCDRSCSGKCHSTSMNSKSGCYCDKRCYLLGDCCIEREVDCDGAAPVNSSSWMEHVLKRTPLPIACLDYGHNYVRVVNRCGNQQFYAEDILKQRDVELCENLADSFETLMPVNYQGVLYKNMYCVTCNHPNSTRSHLISEPISIKCGQLTSEAYNVWNELGVSEFFRFTMSRCEFDFSMPYNKDWLGLFIGPNELRRFGCSPDEIHLRPIKRNIYPIALAGESLDVVNAAKLCSRYRSTFGTQTRDYDNMHCAIVDSHDMTKSKPKDFCHIRHYSYQYTTNTIDNAFTYSNFGVVIDFLKSDLASMHIGSHKMCVNHDMEHNLCLNSTCLAGHMRIDTLSNSSHCVAYEDNSYKQMFSWRTKETQNDTHTLVLVANNGISGDRKPLPFYFKFTAEGPWSQMGEREYNYHTAIACKLIDNPMIEISIRSNTKSTFDNSTCYLYDVHSGYFHGYLMLFTPMVAMFDLRDSRNFRQIVFLNHDPAELEHSRCAANQPKVHDDISLIGYHDNTQVITRFRIDITEQNYHVLQTPLSVSSTFDDEFNNFKYPGKSRLSLICEPRLLYCSTTTVASRNVLLSSDGRRALLPEIGPRARIDVDDNEAAIIDSGDLVVCSDVLSRLKATEKHAEDEDRRRLSLRGQSILATVLSLVGTVVSMCGIAVTLVTYALFKSLRKGPGRSVMSLSSALFFGQSVYMLSPLGHLNTNLCVAIGIAYHFFWLSTFFWMNVMAFDICMVFSTNKASRFTENLRFMFYSFYAWGIPFVFVLVCLTVDLTTQTITYGHTRDCFIDTKDAVLYYFAIPVFVVICLNVVLFSITVYSLRNTMKIAKQARPDGKRRSSLAIYARMTSLMGFTWLFGFLSNIHNLHFLQYPFIVLNTTQGLAIFISFVMTRRVRVMWKKRLQLLLHIDTYKEHGCAQSPQNVRNAATIARRPRNLVTSIRKNLQTRLRIDLTNTSKTTMTSCGSPTTPVKLILRHNKSPSESII